MITQIDKSKVLEASLVLVNDRLRFEGAVDTNAPISIDYIPPLGDGQGYTSLELLLLSLSSCMGSALLTFLRRMQKNITRFEIQAKGIRKEEHPTGFKSIHMQMIITSANVTLPEVDKLLKLAEETYCPVWAMLKGNVIVNVHTIIISEN